MIHLKLKTETYFVVINFVKLQYNIHVFEEQGMTRPSRGKVGESGGFLKSVCDVLKLFVVCLLTFSSTDSACQSL